MSKIALSLPGYSNIENSSMKDTSIFHDPSGQVTLAAAISRMLEVGIYAGGALMFVWAIWGVFDYIKAEGNKEGLAKARKKIQWAIVGFIILILAFLISEYLVFFFDIDPGARTTKPLSF